MFLLLYWLAVRRSPLEILRGDLLQNLEHSAELYRSFGTRIESQGDLKALVERMVTLLIKLLPALIIVGFSVLIWSNLLVFRLLATSKKLSAPRWGELNRWQAPEKLVWVLVASGFATMIPFTTIKWAGINGIIVFALLYFFQGLAIVSFYCAKKRRPVHCE
jgi:hypothetical protein